MWASILEIAVRRVVISAYPTRAKGLEHAWLSVLRQSDCIQRAQASCRDAPCHGRSTWRSTRYCNGVVLSDLRNTSRCLTCSRASPPLLFMPPGGGAAEARRPRGAILPSPIKPLCTVQSSATRSSEGQFARARGVPGRGAPKDHVNRKDRTQADRPRPWLERWACSPYNSLP